MIWHLMTYKTNRQINFILSNDQTKQKNETDIFYGSGRQKFIEPSLALSHLNDFFTNIFVPLALRL